MTDLLEKTEVETVVEVIPYTENDDPKLKTHIVNPPSNQHIWHPGMSSQDVVDIARATGQHVVALCGHSWVPVHNPEKYDLCQVCLDKANAIIGSMG